jgi:hypothetical protein
VRDYKKQTAWTNHHYWSIRSAGQQSDHIYYSSQEDVTLHYTFYQPLQALQKCCAETILLSQISIFFRVTEIFTEVDGEEFCIQILAT